MKIIVHRGTQEIGGSCIEVQSSRSRIILDIGLPLKPIDESLLANVNTERLINSGILPNIPGLYKINSSKPVDGLFISHPHMDHYGLIRYVKDDITYYLGAGAKKLIDLTVQFTSMEGKIQKYVPFVSGTPFNCGDFLITPYLMDHSAFDAYALLIENSGKKFIYSGDFRDHGRKSKVFYWFLKNAPKEVDALILEGTMFGRTSEHIKKEKDVENEITSIINNEVKAVLAYFSAQNIDRLVSFYRSAVITKRIFVIDVYTACVLTELKEFSKGIPYPSRYFKNIRVYFPKFLCERLNREGKSHLISKFKKFEIKCPELTNNKKFIMMVRPSMLIDLKQIMGLNGSTFIYSMWEGYLKENSNQRLLNYIKSLKMKFISIHTSGHASINTLKKVVKELKPQKIIPIHTEYPERFSTLNTEILYLKDKEPYQI